MPDETLDEQLTRLTRRRAEASQARKDAETVEKAYAIEIRDVLGANGLSKWNGEEYVVTMMYPAPRTNIDREKLLLHGVSLDVIAASTKTTPVDPFVRIDPRQKKGKGEEA